MLGGHGPGGSYLAHCADGRFDEPAAWSWLPNLERASLVVADNYGRRRLELRSPEAPGLALVPREDAAGWEQDLVRA